MLQELYTGSQSIEESVSLGLIARYHERAADHAVELSRHLTFFLTGDRVSDRTEAHWQLAVLRRAPTSSAWVGTPGHALPAMLGVTSPSLRAPFGKPVLERLRVAAVAAEDRDGLVGVDVVGVRGSTP